MSSAATPPSGHSDLDPPHEVLQREAARMPGTEEFSRWLAEAEKDATELEAVLRRGQEKEASEVLFQKAAADCARCHSKYRDAPQGR